MICACLIRLDAQLKKAVGGATWRQRNGSAGRVDSAEKGAVREFILRLKDLREEGKGHSLYGVSRVDARSSYRKRYGGVGQK
jgi:hypothetical protein